MTERLARKPIRWVLSVGFVLVSLALVWAMQMVAPGSLSFSPSAAIADNGGTGGSGPLEESVLFGFSGDAGFITDLVLEDDGVQHEVNLTADGMSAGLHDTLQVLLEYDPAIVEIAAFSCAGLFSGASSPPGLVEISPGRTAFLCGLVGGVTQETGLTMQVGLRRVATGTALVEIATDGPFGTRFFAAGKESAVTPTGGLTVLDPVIPATPVATATATALPTVFVPPTGGGGAPAPVFTSPAPVVLLPGPPTNLVAVPGNGEVRLSWVPPTSEGRSPFVENLVRSSDGRVNRSFTASQIPVLITGLENGREYRFRVQVISGAGAGSFSEFSEPVVPAGPPSSPEDVAVEIVADPAQVTLSWAPPGNTNGAEIDSYVISELSGLVSPQEIEPGTFSHTFTGLVPGEYSFAIAAMNRAGTGAQTVITVALPSVAQKPVDVLKEGATGTDLPGPPVAPALAGAASQVEKVVGSRLVFLNEPMRVQPAGAVLRVILPMKVDGALADEVSDTEFAGFSFGELMVEAEGGRPSVGTFDFGSGVKVSGAVTVVGTADAVAIELSGLVLRYSPSVLPAGFGSPMLAEAPAFESQLTSLADLPLLSARRLDRIGSPELPAAPDLLSILLERGWVAVTDDLDSSQILGSGWKIDHSANAFTAGDTVFSFSLGPGADVGLSLIAIKQDHTGTIHVRTVTCMQADTGSPTCSANFDGEAGGFSTFAVLYAEPVQLPSETGPEPSAIPTVVSPIMAVPAETPVVDPTPSTVPAPSATAESFSDAISTVPELPSANSNSPSIVGLVALVSVGLVTVVLLAGYAVSHRNRWPKTGLSLLAIPILASTLMVITFDPGNGPVRASGAIVSQGDAAQLSDAVRTSFGVDGSGITVAIISDSIACDSGAFDADVAAGELPAGLNTNDDVPAQLCPYTSDRGRLVAQVVHDVAPGANIVFSSVVTGKTALASKIQSLVDQGVDIIVDDLLFADELMYQDDVVAQAVDQANQSGVVYLTSAGDIGMASYESTYVSGGGVGAICESPIPCTEPGNWHDFDPGPGVDQMLEITLSGETVRFMLQWDQPSEIGGGPGATSDMDLFVFDQDGTIIAISNSSNFHDGNPGEALLVSGLNSVQVAISHRAGGEPNRVKLVVTNGAVINEFATGSSTIIGHRNASGAITVGPVNYVDTGAFGGVPAVEPSAPTGGTETSFDTSGNMLAPPTLRQKPDIVAPSGVDTSSGIFDGSPAAVAHAAGAVALLLELRSDLHSSGQLGPETVRWVLSQTAVEVGVVGPDVQSGYGLIDVLAAAEMLNVEPPTAVSDDYSIETGSLLEVVAPGVLANDSDQDIASLTAELISGPAHGDLVIQADGSFTYTPAAGFVGEDSFSYVASHGPFTSAPSVVTVTVVAAGSISTSIGLQGVDALANFGADTIFISLDHAGIFYDQSLAPGAPQPISMNGLAPGDYDLVAIAPGFLGAVALDIAVGDIPDEKAFLQPVVLLAGDANGDDVIDDLDTGVIALAFGTSHAPGIRQISSGETTDLNGDGVTNGTDVSLAISNSGLVGPLSWGG